MAQQPRIYSRELVQSVGVIRAPAMDFSGVDALVAGVQRYAAKEEHEQKKQQLYEAKREGFSQALQRDEDGNLLPQPLREPSSDEARAYNTAYETGLLSGYENDIRRRATEFRKATGDNSEAFGAQFEAYKSALLERLPDDYKAKLTAIADGVGTQTINGIMSVERARDYNNAKDDWATTLQYRRNDVVAMAEGGQVGTEEYATAVNEYKARVEAGVAGGFITEEQAKIKFEMLADEGEALAISNIALQTYEAAGGGVEGRKAAQAELDNNLKDPDLKLDPARRRQIERVALERINQQEMIRNAERIEESRRAAEAEKALAAQKAMTQDGFLTRLVAPTEENGGPLTPADVLKSKLDSFGQGSKKTFMDLLEKQAAGIDINKTNPTIFNSLFAAIQQERIKTTEELLPFVGNGISPADYRGLSNDIDDLRSPEMKALASAKTDFFAAAKKRISGSTLIKNDSRGEDMFYRFKTAFNQAFERKVAEGADPMDLLDPTHKDYMGGMTGAYIRTPQQQLQDMADDMRRAAGAATSESVGSDQATQTRPPLSKAMGDELKSILEGFGFSEGQ